MTNDLISVNELRLSKVVTPSHEEIGEVDDVVIHKQSERVAYVILKFGGLMGFGDRKFPIPFSAFYLDTKGERKIILDVKREKLENAPSFDVEEMMADFDYAEFLWKVYKYYDLKPYLSDDKGKETIQLSGKFGTHPKTIEEARLKNNKFDNGHNSVGDRHKAHHGF